MFTNRSLSFARQPLALLCAVMMLAGALPVSAQTKTKVIMTPPVNGTEWWETLEACQGAKQFVYYDPRTTSPVTTMPADHFIAGLGTIGGENVTDYCVSMPLPEIGQKEAWVRQPVTALYIFQKLPDGTVKPIAAAKCHNRAAEVVPNFAPTPEAGQPGEPGPPGRDGLQGPPGPPGTGQKTVNINVDNSVHIDRHDSHNSTTIIAVPRKGHGLLIGVIVGAGVAIVGGLAYAASHHGSNSNSTSCQTCINTGGTPGPH
jgi:hypothetical protein